MTSRARRRTGRRRARKSPLRPTDRRATPRPDEHLGPRSTARRIMPTICYAIGPLTPSEVGRRAERRPRRPRLRHRRCCAAAAGRADLPSARSGLARRLLPNAHELQPARSSARSFSRRPRCGGVPGRRRGAGGRGRSRRSRWTRDILRQKRQIEYIVGDDTAGAPSAPPRLRSVTDGRL